jgi:ubiquinone/menaquinone biosynthesis C-methylase UbiE
MAAPEKPQDDSSFILEDGSAQLSWLIFADNLVTKGMGGVLPERDGDITGIKNILDLGCGPGGWVLNVAFEYPEVEACGVDISRPMVDYANARAVSQGLTNASFGVMDIRQPLDFADGAFDLINARFLFSSFKPQSWPPLLQECMRLLRPGGVLRLTELERSLTNSPAIEQFWDIYARALYTTGRSFSVDGKHIGIIPHLGRLMHEAGFQHIRNRAHAPDMSAWTPDFEGWRQYTMVIWLLLEPFLIESGATTKEEIEQLRQQASTEIWSEGYCGLRLFLTTWGKKP